MSTKKYTVHVLLGPVPLPEKDRRLDGPLVSATVLAVLAVLAVHESREKPGLYDGAAYMVRAVISSAPGHDRRPHVYVVVRSDAREQGGLGISGVVVSR